MKTSLYILPIAALLATQGCYTAPKADRRQAETLVAPMSLLRTQGLVNESIANHCAGYMHSTGRLERIAQRVADERAALLDAEWQKQREADAASQRDWILGVAGALATALGGKLVLRKGGSEAIKRGMSAMARRAGA